MNYDYDQPDADLPLNVDNQAFQTLLDFQNRQSSSTNNQEPNSSPPPQARTNPPRRDPPTRPTTPSPSQQPPDYNPQSPIIDFNTPGNNPRITLRRGAKGRRPNLGVLNLCDLDDEEVEVMNEEEREEITERCLNNMYIKDHFECNPIDAEDALSGWEFYDKDNYPNDECYETADAFLKRYNCTYPMTNADEYDIHYNPLNVDGTPDGLKNLNRQWKFAERNIHSDFLPVFRRQESDEVVNWGPYFFNALQYKNEILELKLGQMQDNLNKAWEKIRTPQTPEMIWETSMERDFQQMLNSLPGVKESIVRPEADDVYVFTSAEPYSYASELCGRLGGIPAAPEHPVVLRATLDQGFKQLWAPGNIIEGFDKGKEDQPLDTVQFPHGTARGFTAFSGEYPMRNPYLNTLFCEELCNVMFIENTGRSALMPDAHIHPRPCNEQHPLLCRLPNYKHLPLLRILTTTIEFTTHRLMSQFQRNVQEFNALRIHLQEVLQPCGQNLLGEIAERRLDGRVKTRLADQIADLVSSLGPWEVKHWENMEAISDLNDLLQEANNKLTSVTFALGHDLFLGCRSPNSRRAYLATRAPGSRTDALFQPSLKEFEELPTSGVAMEVFVPMMASWPRRNRDEETEDYINRIARELTKNLRLYSVNLDGKRTQRIDVRNVLPEIPKRIYDFIANLMPRRSILTSTAIDGQTPVIMRPTPGLQDTMIAVENQDRGRYRVTMSCNNPHRRDTSSTEEGCRVQVTDNDEPRRRVRLTGVRMDDFNDESQSIIQESIADEIGHQYAVNVEGAGEVKDLINESLQRTRSMFSTLEPRQLLGLLHHIRAFDLGLFTQLELSYGVLAILAVLTVWLLIVQFQIRMLACENDSIWTSVYYSTGKNPNRFLYRDFTFSRLLPMNFLGWFTRKLPKSAAPAKVLRLQIGKSKSDKAKEKYEEKLEMEERLKEVEMHELHAAATEQPDERTSFLQTQIEPAGKETRPVGARSKLRSNLKRTRSRDSLAADTAHLKQQYRWQ